MSKEKTITLAQALAIARAGSNRIARASRRLDGLADFGLLSGDASGLLGQAYRDLEDDLPVDRNFTIEDWIAATHELQPMPDAADVWRPRRKLFEIRMGDLVRKIESDSLDAALLAVTRNAVAVEVSETCEIAVSATGPDANGRVRTVKRTVTRRVKR